MKTNLCYVILVIILLFTSQFSYAECRTLRPKKDNTGATAEGITNRWKEVHKGKSMGMMESAYTMSSGPSRRGPGH